jgi:gas vesicle protein
MNLKNLFPKKKSSKKQTAKNVAIGAGIGTAVGVTAGVLLAPKSGKETREDISNTTKKTLENVKEGLNVAKEKIEDMVKKDKSCCDDAVANSDENVSDKVEEAAEVK